MKQFSQASSAESELVVPLEHVSRVDLPSAGGKGANLGELVRAGFPVPPGFVVTTAAYDLFVAHNRLNETTLREAIDQSNSGSTIRTAFESAPIPWEVEGSILAAYQRLGHDPVAVRSSATAEDLPEAAFAGQQDTYLNIVGPEALLDAVRRCWGSLWTDRAIAYREHQGVDQRTVKLAVVVQRLVDADAAGVMFTANPVTGARDEVVIDASPGLGEAVVSGLVTADHFVMKKSRWGWSILERWMGRREVIIRARPGGGTEHIEGPGAAALSTPTLNDLALYRLARRGAAIQNHFGGPQDVEWAMADGKLFILQARPITALPSSPPRVNKIQRLMASTFGELFSIRPYPLDMDTWIPALAGALDPMLNLLGMDWGLLRLFELRDGVVMGYAGKVPRPTLGTLLAPVKLISRIWRYNPILWHSDPLLAKTQARVRELELRDIQALSWEQSIKIVRELIEIPYLAAGEIRCRYFPGAAFAMARLRILLGLLGSANRLIVLLSGVENKTIEVNHALEKLAHQVRSDPNLANTFAAHNPEELWSALEAQPAGHAFLAELRVFLDRYGHRESVISTALQPTWKDAPEVVLGIVKGFATHPPRMQPDPPTWEMARDEILQHPLLHFAPLRSAFLEILTEARTLLQIREDTHFYATLPMPLFRRIHLELGGRLVDAGILDTPEDVFHLKLDELERIGSLSSPTGETGEMTPPSNLAEELRAAMKRRNNERSRLEGTPIVDPRLFIQSTPKSSALLRGTPGSPGVAEGPARIVRNGFEFGKLVSGDVLVAPYTNPSWTPLFQRAVAVVVDTGSAGSHAAIVAREYGIPAVMSTVNGTQTLRDGERIRVDGSQGAVFRVNSETAETERQ